MKRVLLATTALCLGAGTAVADVALSGVAEMGVAASKDNSVRFHTDVDVTFTLSGTTDAGVTFGSAIDIDEASDDVNRNATGTETVDAATQDDDDDGGIAVFMSQPDGFGTITMGDTDGAYDWAMDEIGSGGIRDDSEHGAYNGNAGLDGKHDGQILLWNRDIGSGFSMAASVELHDHKDGANSHDPIVGVGGKFSMPMGGGTVALGGGFQGGSFDHSIADGITNAQRALTDPPKGDQLWGRAAGVTTGHDGELEGAIVGGSAKMDFGGEMGGLSVTLNASMMEADGSNTVGSGATAVTTTADVEQTHLGLGLGYKIGAVSLGLNVGNMVTDSKVDPDSSAASNTDLVMIEETVNGVGFDVAYDLGGGATLKFGVGSHETEYDYTYQPANDPRSGSTAAGHDYSSDANKWSLGVAFAF